MDRESAFTILPPKKPNYVQRLLGKEPRENVVIALNNLFADASRVRHVTYEDIQNIANSYDVNLQRDFKEDLAQLYREYLEYCLADKAMSDEEVRDLSHLKHLLGLNDQIVQSIHNEAIESAYGKAIDEALSDALITPEEKAFIEKIKQELQLPEEIAQRIYVTKAKTYLQEFMDNVVSDERVSPKEEAEFNALAKNLGVEIAYDEKTKSALEKFRFYWLIENGEIPEIQTEMHLQRNEKCYFICNMDWYENRSVTRRIRYGGPTYRIRIAKGLYWRMGDLAVQRVSEDVLAKIDSGRVHLTNRRLLFTGSRKNVTIQLSKILDFVPYKNGIEIQKDSGKSPFLAFDRNVDIFAMILGRVIRDL